MTDHDEAPDPRDYFNPTEEALAWAALVTLSAPAVLLLLAIARQPYLFASLFY